MSPCHDDNAKMVYYLTLAHTEIDNNNKTAKKNVRLIN